MTTLLPINNQLAELTSPIIQELTEYDPGLSKFIRNCFLTSKDPTHVHKCIFHVMRELNTLIEKKAIDKPIHAVTANLIMQAIHIAPPINGNAYIIPFKRTPIYIPSYKTIAYAFAYQNPNAKILLAQIITEKRYNAMNSTSIPQYQDNPDYIENDPITRYTALFVALKQTYKESDPILITYNAKELLNRGQALSTDAWEKHFPTMLIKTAKKRFYLEHVHSNI